MRKVASMLELMRESPLVSLRGRELCHPRSPLWAKLELSLPGAMKDRVALRCVEDAEADGRLQPGGLIVESSSGTLAEGLARVGALTGHPVIIVTDPRIDRMTRAKMEAFGAKVDVVEHHHPTGGWQLSRLQRLHEILAEHPDAFWPQQYDTPSNAGAYEQLAKELLDALGTEIGALVCSVGSGGSISGTARNLRREIPDLQVVAVDAVGSVLFHQPPRMRLQSGHGNNIVASNIDYSQIDQAHWLSDGEAFHGCRELARNEGIFAGGSSGAVYVAACWVARQIDPDRDVVAILPDRGDRYHELIYSDEAFEKHGLSDGAAAAEPIALRYGTEVATRWSYADLPKDGSVEWVAPGVEHTRDLVEQLRAGLK